MSNTTNTPPFTIALVGNPNTGKSTLFNALSGARQRVGNYPGVTVEKKLGTAHWGERTVTFVDLPGTYSLAPRSPDEMVAVDVLLGRQQDAPRPDAVLCIVDANNLERNLYLVSQVLELGLPTVLALNMVDVADSHGTTIDVARLEQRLGIPVVATEAHRRKGIPQLQAALERAIAAGPRPTASPFPEPFQVEVTALGERLVTNGQPTPRYLVERLLLDTSGYVEQLFHAQGGKLTTALADARARLTTAGHPIPAVEAIVRYGWVGQILAGVIRRTSERAATWTDRIDRVLCHKVWGTLIFAFVMLIIFQSVFTWAKPFMDGIEAGGNAVGGWVESAIDPGPLRRLLVDGIIAGVGGVLVFLPQIAILFFFIAILEDCGYMARAAYLMDKLMTRVGLSGKSFIPLLSSFACAIPGVMAARVIEDRRERFVTILIAPLMSCSARLPVYSILIAAFVPERTLVQIAKFDAPLLGDVSLGVTLHGVTLFAMYLVGIVVAAGVAWVLRRSVLRGEASPFVMELPTYKRPSARTVAWRIIERSWGFIQRAGTLILAVSIIVWAALYYPEQARLEQATGQPVEDAAILSQAQRESYLGRAGHAIEPAVRPLGWDWRIGSAAIASFPAREVIVATLGIIFSQGPDVDIENEEQARQLEQALADATWEGSDRKLFTLPVALSIMVFFALCAQCAATLAVIRRETNSWRWPVFAFLYMTTLAYIGAFLTYQIGTWLSA